MNRPEPRPSARRILIVADQVPYPEVKGGVEGRIIDYKNHIFADHQTALVLSQPHIYQLVMHDHHGRLVDRNPLSLDNVSACLVFEIKNTNTRLLDLLFESYPCFGLEQGCSRKTAEPFLGIICNFHRDSPGHQGLMHDNILCTGGFYNDHLFNPSVTKGKAQGEGFALCCGRIAPDKNQLELARNWRSRIYDRFGVPLVLTGGSFEPAYCRAVTECVDGVAVKYTGRWSSPEELQQLLQGCRMLVVPSPWETFCRVLFEALACGVVAVVDGDFSSLRGETDIENIFGSVDKRTGNIFDTIEQVLAAQVDHNGTFDWLQKYSLSHRGEIIRRFVLERVGASAP